MAENPSAFARFCAARAQMAAPVKDNVADTGKYKYSYANLAQVKAVTDPPLRAHGLEAVQHQAGGTLVTRIMDVESGEAVLTDERALTSGNDQGRGSSETYQRRYALMCVCGLAPVDDDGAAAVEAYENPRGVGYDEAKNDAWRACKGYAAANGRDAREVFEGIYQRADFADKADFWRFVAEELRSA